MNRAFRIVWNASRQTWVVAAEIASDKGRTKTTKSRHSLSQFTRALVATSMALAVQPVFAVNGYWAVSLGEWSNPSNWSTSLLPSPEAYVNNKGTVNIGDSSVISITNLRLYDGTLNISDGSLTTNWTIMGDESGTGNLIIQSSEAELISNYFTVGGADNGSLSVLNGGSLLTGSIDIAYGTGSSGEVLVSGSGSSLTVTQDVNLGVSGAGELTLSNNGAFTINNGAGNLILGVNSGSSGTFNVGAKKANTAAQAGTLSAKTVTFGLGTGEINFNHTDSGYVFNQDIVDNNGTGLINILSGNTRFTGDLSGFSGSMNVTGGTLVIASGNTLTLGHTGTEADYSQTADGRLQIGVASVSSFGKLNVTGNATFAKDTGLDVNVVGSPSLTNGSTLSGVITAGTLNASTFKLTDNSALYDFGYQVIGNQVDLNVIADDDSGVLDSVISEGFTPGRGAARVLDTFIDSGITDNDIENVTTALGQLSTQKQVSDAVAETLPLLVEGTTRLAANTLRGTNRVIQSRQASSRGLSSGDEFLVDKALWLKPVGSWSRQQEHNGVSGYDADSYGFVGGIDAEFTPSTRLGVAMSYMNTDVDGNDSASGNSADIDAYQLIAYGSHELSKFEGVEVSWQADVGLNKNDGRRHISFMNRTATADYDSYTAHVGAGIGKRFQWSDDSVFMPSLRADYAYIRDESYTEKGAGALNLDVDSVNAEELILMAQLDVNHQWNATINTSTTLGLGYDVINDDTSLTASYTGGGAAFTTEGLEPSPWLARAGVGATVAINDLTELTASYDLEGREDFLNQTASVKLRWQF